MARVGAARWAGRRRGGGSAVRNGRAESAADEVTGDGRWACRRETRTMQAGRGSGTRCGAGSCMSASPLGCTASMQREGAAQRMARVSLLSDSGVVHLGVDDGSFRVWYGVMDVDEELHNARELVVAHLECVEPAERVELGFCGTSR